MTARGNENEEADGLEECTEQHEGIQLEEYSEDQCDQNDLQ